MPRLLSHSRRSTSAADRIIPSEARNPYTNCFRSEGVHNIVANSSPSTSMVSGISIATGSPTSVLKELGYLRAGHNMDWGSLFSLITFRSPVPVFVSPPHVGLSLQYNDLPSPK